MGIMDGMKSKLRNRDDLQERAKQLEQRAREKGWDDKLRKEYDRVNNQLNGGGKRTTKKG
jgi:hypothetical protein